MLIHWIWLATRPDLNDRDKVQVLSYFRDAEDVFYADAEALQCVDGLTDKGLKALRNKDLTDACAIMRDCENLDIRLCTFHDAAYPSSLKNITDPPLVLYYKGRLPDFDGSPVIATVGTRKCTPYGIHAARKFGGQMARCGAVLVSGIAEGIDAAAMSGALSAGGFVVGVLGSGADIVYPAVNRSLFADTERYGCLISEFPPRTPPYGWNFPKRNRIISGLANGVLVIEAPKKSGSLITVRQAAEQGRDVFVVPGNVDMPTCEGSNALLREGAIPVSRGWDVVSEYRHLYPEKIYPDSSPVLPAGFSDDVMANAGAKEKCEPKVGQNTITPEKNRHSDRKKEKKPIDNEAKPPYSDIRDALEGLNDRECVIAKLLMQGDRLVDEIIAESGFGAPAVLAALTVMEIKGVVKRMPGKRVALK